MNSLADGPIVQGHFGLDHVPFEARCAILGAAGFAGISVHFQEVEQLFATMGEAAMMETLHRSGLSADHLEYVRLPGPGTIAERRRRCEAYVDMACRLKTRGVHAVARDVDATLAEVAESYAMLADCAAERDVLCALEFVPVVSAVQDLPGALEVLDRTDRPNALLVLDSFHFFRSGAPWGLLEGLPAGSILTVQINDGPLKPRGDDYLWEASSGRLLPGDGEFDLGRFMTAVDKVRRPGPVTMEVMSDALDALAPLEVAKATIAAARKVGKA